MDRRARRALSSMYRVVCSCRTFYFTTALKANMATTSYAPTGQIPLHRHLEPFKGLLGTFVGNGHGHYPTMQPFEYREELTFKQCADKPVIAYNHRTWILPGMNPSHQESGFVRVPQPGRAEAAIAEVTGLSEASLGSLTHDETKNAVVLSLKAHDFIRVKTSKKPAVTELQRTFTLTNNATLSVSVDMATETTPMQNHLLATLHRFE